MARMSAPAAALLSLDPVPTLLAGARAELSADFPAGKAVRVSRAPGRLDVMGGIADYTGSLVCEATLDRAAAVALSPRDDRQLQVFSFNLFDDHKPFTTRVSLDDLAKTPIDTLRAGLAADGNRRWAGYLAGCLFVLHEQGYLDLSNPQLRGANLALYSTVPSGAGVSSSAAIEVAAMMNLATHYQVPGLPRERSLAVRNCKTLNPMALAALCQQVENRVVGAPCGIMDQVSSCYGQPNALLRMVCQPHEIQPALKLPAGVRAIGINSNVKHSVGGGQYGRTRCAAFMGHAIILNQMRRIAMSHHQELAGDPMGGYLANLNPDDYKRQFRPHLPEQIRGADFLAKYGQTIDTTTTVAPATTYHVQQATDHHVLEARRVRNFVGFLEQATGTPENSPDRKRLLDKAGHLMYASHISYTNDAMLGADECDLLVKLVRDREPAGLYGAKITGGGSGGTVAVLCDEGAKAYGAIIEIMQEYEKQTGKKPEAFMGSSPGGWHAGTTVVT